MADVLDAKIKATAEQGKSSFGHNGEVYTALRPYTAGGGITGYRFDHGDKNAPYLKVYFISDDGSYLSVWERGYGSEQLRFNTSFDEDLEQTLNNRFNSLNAQLDEAVFHARLATAVRSYEDSGQPQDFEWRGNTYTNLHDPGKSHVDYRFQHGQGEQLKVFFFAEDGSYVSGWSRAGQTTYVHPDNTETGNLYDRLIELDARLPASHAVPFTLEEHLAILEDEPDGVYEFQIASKDMVALLLDKGTYDYVLFTDVDYVNSTYYSPPLFLSDDGTSFLIPIIHHSNENQVIEVAHQWGWSPTDDNELGELLYGNGLKDTLYGRVQLIEYDTDETIEPYRTAEHPGFLIFNKTINQAADDDEIRIQVEGEGRGIVAYGVDLTFDAAINHGLGGSEIQSFNFTIGAYYLPGYGEVSAAEGTFNQGSLNLAFEYYDVFGYNETIVIGFVINERQSGYRVDLNIVDDSILVSAECTANADVSEDLTVSSLEVNCSEDNLESDIEDLFNEVVNNFIELGWGEEQQEWVNVIEDDFHFVDETAPDYVGAFAAVDSDVWVG